MILISHYLARVNYPLKRLLSYIRLRNGKFVLVVTKSLDDNELSRAQKVFRIHTAEQFN